MSNNEMPCPLGFVQPFVKAVVEELAIIVRQGLVRLASVTVPADVRVNTTLVLDFSTEPHFFAALSIWGNGAPPHQFV
jgi:hypothetical protein